MNTELIDRFFLFISTDFFVKYWHIFGGVRFSEQQVSLIQSAARYEVDAFLVGEDVFWNIDFSEARRTQSSLSFQRSVKILHSEALRGLNQLMSCFCADGNERKGTTFALSFLHRIAITNDYPEEGCISPEHREVLAACVDDAKLQVLDTFEIQQAWLLSENDWDKKIRGLTPDIPEYVFLDFVEAYQQQSELPLLLENIELLVSHEESRVLLESITNCLRQEFPTDSDLDIPLVLKNKLALQRT